MNITAPLRTLLLAAAVLVAGPALAQDAQTVKLSVNGMVCSFCAQGIEKRLTKMPETGPLYINLAQKVVLVEPKAGQRIDINKVRAEITEAGYDVTAVETLAKPVAALRAEMKAAKK
jgi:periplasmic mercuric ion binding protein